MKMPNITAEVKRPDKKEFDVDDDFPVIYSYPDPNEKIYWICDYDEDGKLTSVVTAQGERFVTYIPSAEKFYEIRNDFQNEGWIRNKLPKVNVTIREPNGPSRVEKRQKSKEEKKEQKKAKKDEQRKREKDQEAKAFAKRFEELSHDITESKTSPSS